MREAVYIGRVILMAAGALAFAGCGRPFDVNVGTEEPIQVDVSMDVHVYQHGKDSPEAKARREDHKTVLERRRNRMEEVQKLKNNRLVGEDHQGLLSIRNLPAGEYGLYVKKTVEEENADRDFLMNAEAEEKGTTIGEVRKGQWSHWQRKSFPGEWVQVAGEEPDTYRWIRKEAAGKGAAGRKGGGSRGGSEDAEE